MSPAQELASEIIAASLPTKPRTQSSFDRGQLIRQVVRDNGVTEAQSGEQNPVCCASKAGRHSVRAAGCQPARSAGTSLRQGLLLRNSFLLRDASQDKTENKTAGREDCPPCQRLLCLTFSQCLRDAVADNTLPIWKSASRSSACQQVWKPARCPRCARRGAHSSFGPGRRFFLTSRLKPFPGVHSVRARKPLRAQTTSTIRGRRRGRLACRR